MQSENLDVCINSKFKSMEVNKYNPLDIHHIHKVSCYLSFNIPDLPLPLSFFKSCWDARKRILKVIILNTKWVIG